MAHPNRYVQTVEAMHFFSSLKFTVISVVKVGKSLFRVVVQCDFGRVWANVLLELQQHRLLGIPTKLDRALVVACREG